MVAAATAVAAEAEAVVIAEIVVTSGEAGSGERIFKVLPVKINSTLQDPSTNFQKKKGISTDNFAMVARNNGRLAAAASDHAQRNFLRPDVSGIYHFAQVPFFHIYASHLAQYSPACCGYLPTGTYLRLKKWGPTSRTPTCTHTYSCAVLQPYMYSSEGSYNSKIGERAEVRW